MDDDDALLVLPLPTWWEWLAILLGMLIAYVVLGVLIFHFADAMRRRRDRLEGGSEDILLGGPDVEHDRDA